MQYLRITKEQLADIKELSLKINKLRIEEGKEALKHTEVARYLLEKGIKNEKIALEKIKVSLPTE